MTNEEAVKYLQQLYPNGGHCWLDEQRLEAIGMAVKALQEHNASASKDVDLDLEITLWANEIPEIRLDDVERLARYFFELGQQARNWKPADGDDLPEIDREVIALLSNGKVVFAHRPPEYWDGENFMTGKVTRYYPKRYGGGWNMPDVKYWLDVELPKETEL